jgi:simple sugar transport system ATP-binding protein
MDEAAPEPPESSVEAPLLATDSLTKRFGQLTACDHISLEVRAGEIHGLLGENGAGKSTLVKMLYGALAPDEGRLLWQGSPVAIGSPAEARRLGIGMVFQHFSLFEALSVTENVALALPPRSRRELARTVATSRAPTACRSIPSPALPTSRSASVSVSRSSAASCSSRACSSWTSPRRY